MQREQMNRRLAHAAEKGIMIMAHRGVCGANILDNTMESFELALKQGADILEADVFRSVDGKLFVFHDGTEPFMLGTNEKVVEMTSDQIRALRLLNKNGMRIDHGIHTLDEVLEQLKGRCLINLDRCWWCWDSVFRTIKAHHMEDQIIFKSAPEDRYLTQMEEEETPFMYMPIIWYPEELKKVIQRNINMVAVEFIGHSEDAEIMQENYVRSLRKQGIHCMISTLTLANPLYQWPEYEKRHKEKGSRVAIKDGNIYLAAGHDDDTSLLRSPEEGWGWLIRRGFDILQTDWTRELALYLKEKKQPERRKSENANRIIYPS